MKYKKPKLTKYSQLREVTLSSVGGNNGNGNGNGNSNGNGNGNSNGNGNDNGR